MRSSELAGRAGVNSETLRYYERRGLLNEPPRTAGGYRDYPDAAVDLLRFIKRAHELGFTLSTTSSTTPGTPRHLHTITRPRAQGHITAGQAANVVYYAKTPGRRSADQPEIDLETAETLYGFAGQAIEALDERPRQRGWPRGRASSSWPTHSY